MLMITCLIAANVLSVVPPHAYWSERQAFVKSSKMIHVGQSELEVLRILGQPTKIVILRNLDRARAERLLLYSVKECRFPNLGWVLLDRSGLVRALKGNEQPFQLLQGVSNYAELLEKIYACNGLVVEGFDSRGTVELCNKLARLGPELSAALLTDFGNLYPNVETDMIGGNDYVGPKDLYHDRGQVFVLSACLLDLSEQEITEGSVLVRGINAWSGALDFGDATPPVIIRRHVPIVLNRLLLRGTQWPRINELIARISQQKKLKAHAWPTAKGLQEIFSDFRAWVRIHRRKDVRDADVNSHYVDVQLELGIRKSGTPGLEGGHLKSESLELDRKRPR